jgi:hypothetical protein
MWHFKNQYHNKESIKASSWKETMILTPHRGTEAVPA